MSALSPNLLLAYTAYLVGTVSPGPSVLAVMGTAMAQGRARALALAAGVVAGSQIWGMSAAFGMATVMQRYSSALLFSTSAARRGYQAAERPINALLAGVFGLAGLRMLLASQSR